MSAPTYPNVPPSHFPTNIKNTPAIVKMLSLISAPHIAATNARLTYSRALSSLQKSPTYIDDLPKATSLKYVGSTIGALMVAANTRFHNTGTTTTTTSCSSSSTPHPLAIPGSLTTPQTSPQTLKPPSSNPTPKQLLDVAKIMKKVSKEHECVTALKHAQTLSASLASYLDDEHTTFTPVLLIDAREQSHQLMMSTLMPSITCEVRTLPIGDFAWCCKVVHPHGDGEFMLPLIIERKTIDDLVCSLYGTRFNEQRLRMSKVEGQKIYLLEKGISENNSKQGDSM